MEKKRIVFLYTEIAGYFLACVEELLSKHPVEVHVIRYAINKEAPFKFNFSENLTVYERGHYNDEQLLRLIDSLSPAVIVCSGWIDRGYLNVCRQYKAKAVTVLTLDNQWKGTLKQRLATLLSPFYLHKRFSYCWVPGEFQYTYAQQLGFKEQFILTGFYSCDFNYFYDQYKVNAQQKQEKFPKKFIYTGRYVEHKGIKELWKAFIDLEEEFPNEWELWCLGTGTIAPVEHPKIRHFGFVQPQDLHTYISQTGVFVLPSYFEPWGVVLHEFAASGFPLICSTEAGARTAFVENNLNGYIYDPTQINELKAAMAKVMKAKSSELIEMGKKSTEKAKQITPTSWANQLIALL